MRFEFATATEIVFGPGVHRTLAERARRESDRAFVVTGAGNRTAALVRQLDDGGGATAVFALGREPTFDDAREATRAARDHGAGVVVAIGGGSAIDLGKAVSALLTNPGDPLDYVEVIGRGRPIAARAAPFIAVPTTAGAGAEATRNAVLASRADGMKVSLRSALMIPRLALVDPELTLTLPPGLTAATGMDALTQLVEPYVSVRANPMTDALCLDGLARAARSLRRAVEDGRRLDARTDMSLAALLGGVALANAGLGAVHGFAAAIGGRFPAPHGAVCAALLPGVMRANLRALEARAPGGDTVGRYAAIARVLTGNPRAEPFDAVDWAESLRTAIGIPRLAAHGLGAAETDALVEAAMRSSSMKANPIALERGELIEVLTGAM